jgi:hypothetical protein
MAENPQQPTAGLLRQVHGGEGYLTVGFRCTLDDKTAIDAWAAADGLSRSLFMLRAVRLYTDLLDRRRRLAGLPPLWEPWLPKPPSWWVESPPSRKPVPRPYDAQDAAAWLTAWQRVPGRSARRRG